MEQRKASGQGEGGDFSKKYRKHPDLSSVQFDGSQSLSKRGGEGVGSQFHRKGTTSKMMFLYDNNGIPLSCSEVISGNPHDAYDVESQLYKILAAVKKSNIRADGLFINSEAGFDGENLRNYCMANELSANIDQMVLKRY